MIQVANATLNKLKKITLLRKIVSSILPIRLKESIKRVLRDNNSYIFHNNYTTYSDCAEDRILYYLFKNKKEKGFYIDIGAYKPVTVSNTYFFYQIGWRGINIDAFPESMKEFDLVRKEDIAV